MSDVLNKLTVLKLNANWQPLEWTTPKRAFIDMCGGQYGGTPPALGIDISFDEDGNLTYAHPTKWEDWQKLPVRECDLSVITKTGPVRVPTVLVAPNYREMPLVEIALSNEAILQRDGLVDQYTGEKLTRAEATVDHVVPKDRGGAAKDWSNMVTCRKDRNHKKGNKLNEEVGYKLIRKPFKPKAMPKSFLIDKAKRPEQAPFIRPC
jgi:hypothetical protein